MKTQSWSKLCTAFHHPLVQALSFVSKATTGKPLFNNLFSLLVNIFHFVDTGNIVIVSGSGVAVIIIKGSYSV
jgi:hypothetical protein